MSFIPYGKQTISNEDIAAVCNVLKSTHLTQGPEVPRFENALKNRVHCEHAVAFNSATSALHIACLALGLGKGDLVWTSPTTFVASANCAIYCGCKVDFVDIDITTGLMSTRALEIKLKEAAKTGDMPAAVIPVHLCGASCDMKTIRQLARLYDFKVIEDASHAIGGKYLDSHVGSCRYSDITVFSFHPVKIITTGEGGLACTNDTILATRMRDLRSHGIVKEEYRFENDSEGPWHYEQQSLGFNYRMNDISAALGTSQLNRLSAIIKERNRILSLYKDFCDQLDGKLLEVPSGVLSSVHLVVFRAEGVSKQKHRAIFEGMRKAGIGVQLHYSPVHLQPYYKKTYGFAVGDFPEAERYAREALSLPVYPGLEENKISEIVRCLSNAVNS